MGHWGNSLERCSPLTGRKESKEIEALREKEGRKEEGKKGRNREKSKCELYISNEHPLN